MNTFSLECIISKYITPPHARFLGVFAADEVADAVAADAEIATCFIANTDPAEKPGEHWIAFFYDHPRCRPRCLYFFDSYGETATDYGFIIHGSLIRSNPHHLQGLNSKVCGEYCMLYLILRAHGVPHLAVCNWFAALSPNSRDARIHAAAAMLASRVGNCALDCMMCHNRQRSRQIPQCCLSPAQRKNKTVS